MSKPLHMPKKKYLSPRRKRMRQQSRLEAAKHWIPTYPGKNIVKGYQNWFGVDLVCAIRELKILGIKLDDEYVSQAIKCNEHRIALRQQKREEKKKREWEDLPFDSDDHFYYIVGYTNGGFPYGITWEQAELDNLVDPQHF